MPIFFLWYFCWFVTRYSLLSLHSGSDLKADARPFCQGVSVICTAAEPRPVSGEAALGCSPYGGITEASELHVNERFVLGPLWCNLWWKTALRVYVLPVWQAFNTILKSVSYNPLYSGFTPCSVMFKYMCMIWLVAKILPVLIRLYITKLTKETWDLCS